MNEEIGEMKKYENPTIDIIEVGHLADIMLGSGQVLSDPTGDFAEDIFGG